jgi:hypothetical protein
MNGAAAREELHRASNVLTSYYDIQVDSTLRDAIRTHLNNRDHRWLMGHPGIPATPAKRTRSCHAEGEGKENKIDNPQPAGADTLKASPQPGKWRNGGICLRRANSSVLPRGSDALYL